MSGGRKAQGGSPPGHGPGHGPGPHGRGMAGGKPDNAKEVVGRLLNYVGRDKGKVMVALVCAIASSGSSG